RHRPASTGVWGRSAGCIGQTGPSVRGGCAGHRRDRRCDRAYGAVSGEKGPDWLEGLGMSRRIGSQYPHVLPVTTVPSCRHANPCSWTLSLEFHSTSSVRPLDLVPTLFYRFLLPAVQCCTFSLISLTS